MPHTYTLTLSANQFRALYFLLALCGASRRVAAQTGTSRNTIPALTKPIREQLMAQCADENLLIPSAVEKTSRIYEPGGSKAA